MDLSKLNSNEKLAVYGAIASIVGPILAAFGFGFGVGWLTLILAIAMLAIVFMPQWSPQTTLPGSKGSLMLIVGGIAAVSALLALLSFLGFMAVFGSNVLFMLGWLIGIIGGLLMGWAGWQEFQAEGGKFQLGGTTTGTGSAAPPAPPAATPPPAAAPAPPAETQAPAEAPRSYAPPADTAPPATDTTADSTTPSTPPTGPEDRDRDGTV